MNIYYWHSALSVHDGEADFKIKAGDRMTYFTIDEKSIYDFLRDPKFHFLILSNKAVKFDESKSQNPKGSKYIDYQSFPLTRHVAEIFGTEEPFSILLRPDNYIGFVSAHSSADELKVYPFLADSFQVED